MTMHSYKSCRTILPRHALCCTACILEVFGNTFKQRRSVCHGFGPWRENVYRSTVLSHTSNFVQRIKHQLYTMKSTKQEAKSIGSESQLKQKLQFFTTKYTSETVEIPENFLRQWAHDKIFQPKMERIDFVANNLPEYKGLYAYVIDNALTPSECSTMLKLVEESAGQKGWQPALVNAGRDIEVLAQDYRNSDRIIWDSEEIVARLWRRCLESAPSLESEMAVVDSLSKDKVELQKAEAVLGFGAEKLEVWKFLRVNERMRFLRYGQGQFFAPHCDGSYEDPDRSTNYDRTLYTIQLYLNEGDIKGGATTFWSRDQKRRLDVTPKLGRVLIFQHRRLYHSGDIVQSGVKYSMRTDIMYRLQKRGK